MNEREFLRQLKKRAKEQKKIMNGMPFPSVFSTVSEWFGNYPYRYLIPLAFLISLLLRALIGSRYTDFTLWIFSAI